MYTQNTANTLEDVLLIVFERLDKALPEFEFEQYRDGWRSTNTVKLDGRIGKTVGQVICTHRKPTLLADHSDGEYLSFWDYIQRRDQLDNGQTYKKLLELAGIEFKAISEGDYRARKQAEKTALIWEYFIQYTQKQLLEQPNTDTTEYKEIQQYLTNTRNYTPADVQALGIGWLNKDWPAAIEYIKSRTQHSTDDINEAIHCSRDVIGYTHKLIIPMRNRSGRVVGIAARNINWSADDKLPKYLYNKGLPKRELLHSLPYKAEAVLIVEGPLDADICKARGFICPAVAIGGKDATKEQIQQLLKSSVKNVYICLDNEEGTIKAKQKLIELILEVDEEGQIGDRIFCVQLPSDVKDVDELLTTKPNGLEQLNTAVFEKHTQYFRWQTEILIQKYNASEKPTDAAEAELIDEVVKIAAQTKQPYSKEVLLNEFTELLNRHGILITHNTLELAAQRIKEKIDYNQQQQALQKTLKKAATYDEPAEALDYLKKQIRDVERRNRRAEFESLYSAILDEKTMLERCKEKPKAVQLGFLMQMEDELEELEAPAGQLTFFAAKTGHGKTKFLLNVALNILEKQPEKNVHFFTYEIDDVGVMQFALNAYIGEEISGNNRRSLRSYFRENSMQYIKNKSLFEHKKNQFFERYINSGRLKIHHTEYSADELIQYIEYVRSIDVNAVLIIDYVQKLRSDRKGNIENRHTELKFVCEDLNACAIRTGLPVLMAAQFTRYVDTPLDVAPTKLAEASDIEKISSEIYSIWDYKQPLTGKPDSSINKAINKRYGLDYDILPADRQPTVILEILKSRLYGPGYFTLLNNCRSSGRITQDSIANTPKPNRPMFVNK